MHQTPKLAQLTQPAHPACSQARPDHGHGRAPPRLAPYRAPLLRPASLLPSAPTACAHAPLPPVRLLAAPPCTCCARPACAYLRLLAPHAPRACLCRTPVPYAFSPSARARLAPCAPSACPPCRCAAPQHRVPLPARAYTNPCAQPMLKWAVAHFRFCIYKFFFSFFFFLPLENTKKNIYLFSFIFQYTNKFIKIYFFIYIYIYIYFFFHFPTNQINCLNLFYLFFCSSLHIVNSYKFSYVLFI